MSDSSSAPGSSNLAFVEALYSDYLQDPASVSEEWQSYFKSFLNGEASSVTKPKLGPTFRPRSLFNAQPATIPAAPKASAPETGGLQERLNQLINSYRVRGHMAARIDPLGLPRTNPPELDPAFWGLTEDVFDQRISSATFSPDGQLTIREILDRLKTTYCQSIGAQYMYIDDLNIRRWLQKRMEPGSNRLQIGKPQQSRILKRLTSAVTFEEFIRKKFPGSKSFSLEGSESLIPLLDLAIEKAATQGVKEIVLGMAHRGRLNVLANIMGKNARQIFREFADADPELYVGRGDVKYHLGYSSDWETAAGQKVHLSLCFNPSHLEFVNPVVLGRIRAKQDRTGDTERVRGLALLIHGDAAFPGEGITQETLNLSQLVGYSVGGTLHVVVNNQIGFTTSPSDSRSTVYATDVAKMLQSPIFHVNGEDPEAVAQVVQVAMDFRSEFKRDVFIDMYGYRRLGHNEGDEPSFTQPLLYRAIKKRKTVREGYLEHLLKLNEITREEADKVAEEAREHLEKELSAAHSPDYRPPNEPLRGLWSGNAGGPDAEVAQIKTGVDKNRLSELLAVLTKLPENFHPHERVQKILEARREMGEGKKPLDWATGESLAFATLATEKHRIRLSGQDSGRGTFSHRHAVIHDFEDGHTYIPLQHLSPDQGKVNIWNSPLSEAGVMGFDYGYSLDYPDGLILWEAQYGDFANTAQVIIDQFIVSAEDKWRRLSGLVLLLPHGFEGSGPEHSSARLERFLTLAAEDNIQVVCPTTAAQYFHLLRRQVVLPWRKPLVVMTPKGLLRDPRTFSTLEECAEGEFKRLIPDTTAAPDKVKRILLCTGKVYFDLDEQRQKTKREDVAIIRLEQLYPLRQEELQKVLAGYREGTPAFWVQEEPANMGSWHYILSTFGEKLLGKFPLKGISRPQSASPATGSMNCHKQEQKDLVAEALGKS